MIDNSFFFKLLTIKIKVSNVIKSKISFRPIAPILYIINGKDSGDKIIKRFLKSIISFLRTKYN